MKKIFICCKQEKYPKTSIITITLETFITTFTEEEYRLLILLIKDIKFFGINKFEKINNDPENNYQVTSEIAIENLKDTIIFLKERKIKYEIVQCELENIA